MVVVPLRNAQCKTVGHALVGALVGHAHMKTVAMLYPSDYAIRTVFRAMYNE